MGKKIFRRRAIGVGFFCGGAFGHDDGSASPHVMDKRPVGGADKRAGAAFDAVHERELFRRFNVVGLDALAEFGRRQAHRTGVHAATARDTGLRGETRDAFR